MWSWLKGFPKPHSPELENELQFHLDQLVREGISQGLSPQEARRAAILEFGGAEGIKEELRDVHRIPVLDSFRTHLKYAFRALRAAPLFSLTVIATLTLGIGANTVVFSAIDAVLLRPLPFANADRLEVLREFRPKNRNALNFVAPARLEDWNRLNGNFSGDQRILHRRHHHIGPGRCTHADAARVRGPPVSSGAGHLARARPRLYQRGRALSRLFARQCADQRPLLAGALPFRPECCRPHAFARQKLCYGDRGNARGFFVSRGGRGSLVYRPARCALRTGSTQHLVYGNRTSEARSQRGTGASESRSGTEPTGSAIPRYGHEPYCENRGTEGDDCGGGTRLFVAVIRCRIGSPADRMHERIGAGAGTRHGAGTRILGCALRWALREPPLWGRY